MKRVAALFLSTLIFLVVLLSGCSGSRSPEEMLVGRWEFISDARGEDYIIFADQTFIEGFISHNQLAQSYETSGTYAFEDETLKFATTERNGEPMDEIYEFNCRFYYDGKGLGMGEVAIGEKMGLTAEILSSNYYYASGWMPTSVEDRIIGCWRSSGGRNLTFFANGVWTSSDQNTNDPFQTIGTYTVLGEKIRLTDLYGDVWEYDVSFDSADDMTDMTLTSVTGNDLAGLAGEYIDTSGGAFYLPDDSFDSYEGIDPKLYGAWAVSTDWGTGVLLLMENGLWLRYYEDGSFLGGIYRVEDDKITLANMMYGIDGIINNYIVYNYGLSASSDKLMLFSYGQPTIFTRTDFPDEIKLR